MNFGKWSEVARYVAQTEMVGAALRSPDHSLDRLLELMRSSGEAALYLAGTRLDHEFCFGSSDVGVLLSVLPEDSSKAGDPGYHPGSTEVYVTFQGRVILEYLEGNRVVERVAGENEVVVLRPGECHRVRTEGEKRAASLIVKTNLRHTPGVIRCAKCTYFPEPANCPLHRRWKGCA